MNRDIAGYQRRTTILLVASSLTTALALFAVFRVTAEAVTASWIGAWSLLQGLFLVARVSDSGAGNNISRVIALRMKEGLELDLRNFSVASLLIASGPSIALTLATAPLIGIYITHQFENDLPSNQLWTLVWLALLTSIITAVSNILLAICEGAFELNYKSTVTILANAVGVMSIGPLLHAAGPAGIGWTYAVMSATQLLLGITRVAMLAAHAPKVRASAVIENARALWRENLPLSGIAVIRLSFEPVTKLLLSLYAPLIVIAQFELALRVTTQIRVILQSALQPLLVLGARSNQSGEAAVHSIFNRNDRILSILSVIVLLAQVTAAPAIQLAGLGFIDALFITIFGILAAGNAANTMGIAGYYWQFTSGTLAPLIKLQAIMAIVNVGFGLLGRIVESTPIVVSAYAAAFTVGGFVSRSFLPQIPFLKSFANAVAVLILASLAVALLISYNPSSATQATVIFVCGTLLAFIAFIVVYLRARRS